jgi:hypothetical protein
MLHILLAYLIAWHVSFLLIFLSRGDSINAQLHYDYLRFVFSPGLEIPSFNQIGAGLLTGVYFLLRWIKRIVRRLI